jgi:cell division protein FtsQ
VRPAARRGAERVAGHARTGADRAGMERRLAERRLAILREGGRRRRRILGVALLVACFAAVLWKLSGSSLFELTGIEVSGNDALSTAQVVAAAGVADGEPILNVDTVEVRARIERLPYVAHATVARVPPAGLRIEITERRPAATVGDADHPWLVAADGTVLAPAQGANATAGLPNLKALPGDPPSPGMRYPATGPFANALAAVQGMDPRLRRLVTGIEAPSVEGLRFTLGGGAVLTYGRAERQAAKDAAALLLLRNAKAGRKEVARVDVRAPRTPVLVTRDAAGGAP